jgi:solute carrier family 25 folate transporter 32
MEADRKASPWVHSVAALTAGVVSTTLTHPLDLVKARFQVQRALLSARSASPSNLQYRNTLQAFRLIAQQEGIRGW